MEDLFKCLILHLIRAILPSGIICMWHGSIATIPDGWAFCDGTNGTPDLKSMFIVGAQQDEQGIPKAQIYGVLQQEQYRGQSPFLFSDSNFIDNDPNGIYGPEVRIPYYALAFIMKL